jgi:hypothetical protein
MRQGVTAGSSKSALAELRFERVPHNLVTLRNRDCYDKNSNTVAMPLQQPNNVNKTYRFNRWLLYLTVDDVGDVDEHFVMYHMTKFGSQD